MEESLWPWRGATIFLLSGSSVLTITYVWLAIAAANACYVTPCMEGVGTEELWKVDKGVAACCIVFGFVAVLQALLGLWMFTRHDPRRSQFLIGLFVGMTLLVAFTMLGQSGLWMAQWNLVYDLSEISSSSPIFVQSGRQMAVDQSLRGDFRSLCLVAAFACLLELLVAVHLWCHFDKAVAFFALRGGVRREEAAHLSLKGDQYGVHEEAGLL
mmetsp:Transcript_25631/g.76958  ORF Transcript_25631/g.76958 Transcript_25631/m.76958 type:complete len:213 (+) Transcript_25631:348-986(+)